ncbi:MAG: hypothetical protein C0598_12760 [Marinilabiliales bacterium]|nr:MAG: hypothetical protein C0598_12760 [Marinilabiliales bacterium]
MRKTTLTEKLVIASFAISIVIIILVSSLTFFRAKSAILDRTFQQLTSIRVVKANLLERYFENAVNMIKLVKQSNDILMLAEELNHKNSEDVVSQKIPFSTSFIKQLKKKPFNRIYIIGNNNLFYELKSEKLGPCKLINEFENLASEDRLNDKVYFFQTENPNNSPENFIYLSSPLFNSRGIKNGFIVFEISYNSIDNIMLEQSDINGFGISGESYLVGKDYLMRSTSRFTSNSILNTSVKTESVDSAMEGKSGTKIIEDYRGIKVLSSFSPLNISQLNWLILVEIDYSEATIPIVKARNQILFFSIFIFVIVLIVTVIFSRRITFPIQKLNNAANQIIAGNYNVEIKNTTNDEIGDLTITFNKMSKQLKESSLELQAEKRRTVRALIDGQENERHRLSRELHDSLGQLLIGLKMKYESCINSVDDKKIFRSSGLEMGHLFDKTIEETRRISHNLAPVALSEFGLRTALRNMINDISETSAIKVELVNEVENNFISVKDQIYIFRIIQEAITNVLKHSKASKLSISLSKQKDNIIVQVIDNGVGFNLNKIEGKKDINGLKNIYNRVTILKGEIKISTAKSEGTKLYISIPSKNQGDVAY